MSTSDAFVKKFELLLNNDEETERFSLQDWQFAYKKVIFKMGLKILDKYPLNAFGPEPPRTRESKKGVGPAGPPPTQSPKKGPGPHPAGGWGGQGPIIHVAIAALELAPPPPPH